MKSQNKLNFKKEIDIIYEFKKIWDIINDYRLLFKDLKNPYWEKIISIIKKLLKSSKYIWIDNIFLSWSLLTQKWINTDIDISLIILKEWYEKNLAYEFLNNLKIELFNNNIEEEIELFNNNIINIDFFHKQDDLKNIDYFQINNLAVFYLGYITSYKIRDTLKLEVVYNNIDKIMEKNLNLKYKIVSDIKSIVLSKRSLFSTKNQFTKVKNRLLNNIKFKRLEKQIQKQILNKINEYEIFFILSMNYLYDSITNYETTKNN